MRPFIFMMTTLLAWPLWAGTPEAMSLLKANCFSCHNAEKEKGGLNLTTRKGLLAGGEEGKVITPGKAGASRIIQVLQPASKPHMPPKGQLSPRAIETLTDWVDAGAEWDEAYLKDRRRPSRDQLAKPSPAGPGLGVALSPEAKRLAVARGSEVLVHDLADKNKVVAKLGGHRDAVRSVAWSGDGKWLATGGYRMVRLWNADLKLARELGGLDGRVTAICFSDDNATVFTADGVPGTSGIVRQWNLADGKKLAEWTAHADTVHALALTRDGTQLATGGDDNLAKVWEVATRKEAARFEAHHGPVYGVAFRSDGAQLATAGGDHELLIWDLKSLQKLTEIRVHKGGVTAVRWTPDDKVLVTACEDGTARVFTEFKNHDGAQRSGTARERRLSGSTGRLHAVTASADAGVIAATSQNGSVYVWQKQKLTATLKPEGEAPKPAGQLSFVKDVLPILSKAGCNAGSCHAKPDGQSGFKLSVFSYDPRGDWRELTEDARGRRVFVGFPGESLFIKKATLAMPHEGGQRIAPGSASEKVLLDWVRQGMVFQHEDEPVLANITVAPATGTYRKGQAQALKATAHYSDDSTRDITALADFVSNDGELAEVDKAGRVTVGRVNGEGTVMARYTGQVAIARITVPAEEKIPAAQYSSLPKNNFIDELAHAQFARLGLLPSKLATDAEFLRRASLDAIGRLPTAPEAKAFLDDKSADKRAKLIDRLLADAAYADHWANHWADLVRPNPDRAGLKSVYVLDQWLREAFRENLPMDRFARDMVAASGSTHRFGPAVVYRDKRTPPELAKIFSQVFLGTRLECARCHNHPNEKWTLTDFHAFSAFFGKIGRKGAGVSPPISGGTEWFYHGGNGSVKHPVTGDTLSPKPPDAPAPTLSAGADPRQVLVDWMTQPENPFFARAMVNRVWGNFFGRGLVEPVDDMRASNPPVNAALLDALAKHFIKIKYDQKALIRTLMQSHLYQLSSTPNRTNLADTRHFSRSYRRRLRAEVLLDAVCDVTGVPESFSATWPGARAVETWNFKIGSEFLDAFGRPNSSSDPPCERNTSPTIVQALHMMHAEKLGSKLTHDKGRARTLAAGKKPVDQIADEVYLAALSRRPTAKERALVAKFYADHPDGRQAATEDLIWVILNSAEFMFNH